jgi:manganese/iron transport system ATP-binding protein
MNMEDLVARIKKREITHMAQAPTVELDDVWVAYAAGNAGTVRTAVEAGYALEAVTLQVDAGQQVAVVGPNGAGKSTLFKVIAGTLKPSRGKARVYGHDPDCHICIAYVPQRNQIDWSFPVTVEDVVMMGRIGQIGLFRWPRRADWQLVHASLERVGLLELRRTQIGELSGGQQQRVFIARALAQHADILLLDEPFSGLDVPTHDAILTILSSLKADSVTVLIATHDLALAAERFDRVMLLNRRMIAYGRAENVLVSSNLLQAYGGHSQVISAGSDGLLLTDSCCDQGDEDGPLPGERQSFIFTDSG